MKWAMRIRGAPPAVRAEGASYRAAAHLALGSPAKPGRMESWFSGRQGGPSSLVSVSMRAQLLPLEGGIPIDLAKEMTLIGRKEDCDVRLDHKSVSKMHCVIVKTDGLLLLRDLGSTNGTRVNGQRVRRAAL